MEMRAGFRHPHLLIFGYLPHMAVLDGCPSESHSPIDTILQGGMDIEQGLVETVIVVGAGAAGLAMADALQRRGISVRVLEMEARLGEQWRRRHDQLQLNTHRALSKLSSLAYPAGTRAFPHKDVMVDYLARFAADRKIDVTFNTPVDRIERKGDCWLVHTPSGQAKATHVVIATGRDRLPFIPAWPGLDQFRGTVVHAADFGSATSYENRNVLVVGAGNSGFDVLNHLVRVNTGSIWLSARNGPTLMPKRIGSLAVPRFAGVMARLPVGLADLLLAAVQRLAFGDLRRYGLPSAPKGGASRLAVDQIAIAVDEGAARAIRAGRIKVLPPVKAFTSDAVVLSDGNSIRPDIVIAATGYRTGLETMLEGLDVLDANGVPLVNGAVPCGQPGLWFIGMRPSLVSLFQAASIDAQQIAERIEKGSNEKL